MIFHPKVSIVIPVYNGSNYLREAINSALSQTYKNIEVIVVNDGSTDEGKTREIALAYGKKIRYFEKENGGVATALNLGIEKMTGEYFSWLSHDDVYRNDKIEAQINFLEKSNEIEAIVFSDWQIIHKTGYKLDKIKIKAVHPDKMEYYFIIDQSIHGCSLLIPRKAFSESGNFPEHLKNTQDYALWLKMSEKYRFLHCPKTLVYGRTHEMQGSMKDFHKEEIHSFFQREIKRMTSLKIQKFFSKKERRDACLNLISNMKIRGFYDCAEIFYHQIKDLFTSQDQKYLMRELKKEGAKMNNFVTKITKKLFSILKGTKSKKNDYKLNFDEVYQKNLFIGNESLSGRGSNLDQTEVLRKELVSILKKLKVKTFLDVPCGDFNWMRYIDFQDINYIGGDIVESLVNQNQDNFGNEKRKFIHLDLTSSKLPLADVIFCRDCLVHLNNAQIFKVLANIKKSGIKYLMTTTFTNRNKNEDLLDGIWRPLNLEKTPFNFPQPDKLINEDCPEENGAWKDKCIGIWKVENIETKLVKGI